MKYIQPEGSISACPACGYQDGFHVSFNFENNSREGQIILICPACHQRFDIGWPVSVTPPE